MKLKTIGILLLVIGGLMIIYTGVTFFTTETVLEVGEVEINRSKSHPVSWSPYWGIGVAVLGAIFLFIPKKKG